MIDGQATRAPSFESTYTRVDTLTAGPVAGRAAHPGGRGIETLVRADLRRSPTLGGFLIRRLSAAADGAASAPAATLATLLADPEPWPVETALLLLDRIAALLDAADAAGIVLGTFTPTCVVVSSRHLALARPDARAGVDPASIAPEQLQRGAWIDGRASQYGFALVASTLLNADAPSNGLLRSLRRGRAGPGALSIEYMRAVQRVVLVARDPDPARRFRTASDFIAALGAACGEWALAESVAVVPPPAWRGALLIGGMTGFAACAGAMGWYAARRPAAIPPELANNIAIRRVVTDTSRSTIAADVAAPTLTEQYGDRLLMAAPPESDSTTPGRVGLAKSVALPQLEVPGGALRRTSTGGNGEADVTPTLLDDGNAPAYPADLLRARLQGDVVVRFVVDTAGRVDPGTFTLVRSSNPSFTNSVRGSLGHLHFRPAEHGGRRVPTAVEQRFQFAVPPR